MPAFQTAGGGSPRSEAVYEFAARGAVRTRKMLEKLQTRIPSNFETLYAKVRDRLQPLGFTAIENLYLDEDDTSANKNIWVSVGVRLRGRPGLAQTARTLPAPLRDALEQLADMVSRDIDADVQPRAQTWRLANEEEFEH